MKKRLIILLAVMLVGALAYQLMRNDSGYVLIAYGHTRIEMSLWTGLALWLLILALVWLALRILSGGRRIGRVLFGAEKAISARAQSSTMAALVDFIEGNWQAARKQLVKGAGKSVSPLVNYLAAARCAYELGDFEGALQLLHKAERCQGSSELAVALTQASMQLQSKRYEQCLATLKRIKRIAPEHPVMLDLMADVYWALDDIDALEELLPQLHQGRIRSKSELQALSVSVFSRQLRRVVKNQRKEPGEQESYKVQLDNVWCRMPRGLYKTPELMADYAIQLAHLGYPQEAEPWLVKSLKSTWNAEWLDLYGRIAAEDVKAQLQTALRWQKEHGDDPVLLCTLGRLSLRNELWGKARDYFYASIALQPSAQVYAELSRLQYHMGEHETAHQLSREGLQNVISALPELPQPHLEHHE